MAPIRRVTLFTTQSEAEFEFLKEKYGAMQAEATKDGKPYILSVTAGPTIPDERSKGINFVAITTFASVEDMHYYDNEDAAHGALKAGLKGKLAGPPIAVYFEEAVVSGF